MYERHLAAAELVGCPALSGFNCPVLSSTILDAHIYYGTYIPTVYFDVNIQLKQTHAADKH